MPDTANYYYAAYAVTVLFYGGYALSIALRRRALERRRRRQQADAGVGANAASGANTGAATR